MSWTPKYSKQFHGERNCGHHCISMITGYPIDFITQQLGIKKGTTSSDLCQQLNFFGIDADFNSTKYLGGVLPRLCIICHNNHWALYFDGEIWCSCTGIIPFSKFRHRIKYYIGVKVPE